MASRTNTQELPDAAPIHKNACTICAERKVKCDRKVPCSNCVKGRVDCKYVAPPPRQKRKRVDDLVLERLKHYEDLLKEKGFDVGPNAEVESERQLSPLKKQFAYPKPMARIAQKLHEDDMMPKAVHTSSRTDLPLRNTSLWSELSDELRAPGQRLEPEGADTVSTYQTPNERTPQSGSSLLMGSLPADLNLSELHPSPTHIFRLWQVFLERVNPLVKILHVPTTQHKVLDMIGANGKTSNGMHVLMFSIYTFAVVSLSEEECETMIGSRRGEVLSKFRTATQQALINADFIETDDMMVLQGFVLLLLAVYDNNALCVFSSVALRIGERLGINQDSPEGVSIFDEELGRRLWWQIVFLERRAVAITGNHHIKLTPIGRPKLPLNVNDSDLFPQMEKLPVDHTGPTEMLYPMLKFESNEYLYSSSLSACLEHSFNNLHNEKIPMEQRDRAVEGLEQNAHEKYLKYCDYNIPLHHVTALVVKSAVCRMRIYLHHPRFSETKELVSEEESDLVFESCVSLIKCDNEIRMSKFVARLLTHQTTSLHLDAFIYILSELRKRTIGEMVDRAWTQVEVVFGRHPEVIEDMDNSLFVALGDLTLIAWESRNRAGAKTGLGDGRSAPGYITQLKAARRRNKGDEVGATPQSLPGLSATVAESLPDSQADYGDGGALHHGILDFQFGPMGTGLGSLDWQYWGTLMQEGSMSLYGFEEGPQMPF